MKFIRKGRIWVVFASLLLILPVVLSGCGGEKKTELGPIKIGALFPLSGYLAAAGQEGLNGINYYLDEIGHKVAGRDIEVIAEDTETTGSVALDKATKLVESDKVDVLTGIVSSGVAIALRDYVTNSQVPLILGMSGSTTLCFKMPSPYIVGAGHINGDHTYVGVKYMYDVLGARKAIAMYSDYAAGQEYFTVFKGAFEALGGEVVEVVPTPPGTLDFAAYLTQIQNVDADVVWTFYADAESAAFMNQYSEFGLKDKWPLIGGQGGTTTPAALDIAGDNAVGIYVGCHTPPFGPLPGRPVTEEFATNFVAKYGAQPGPMAYTGYQQAQVIAMAFEALGGEYQQSLDIVDAIVDLDFEGLCSPIKFDKQYNWVITNGYFFKVIKETNGDLGFDLLATYEDIGPSLIAPFFAS